MSIRIQPADKSAGLWLKDAKAPSFGSPEGFRFQHGAFTPVRVESDISSQHHHRRLTCHIGDSFITLCGVPRIGCR
jgi:hypothetical protein